MITEPSATPKWMVALGGRKAAKGFAGSFLITGYALLTHPPFLEYSFAVGALLGLVAWSMAWEDAKQAKARSEATHGVPVGQPVPEEVERVSPPAGDGG
jgi:hypothetical protein